MALETNVRNYLKEGKALMMLVYYVKNKRNIHEGGGGGIEFYRLLLRSNKNITEFTDKAFFFFFWWGLLHGPQQGPDRMKEKNLKDLEKENSCLKQKKPP